MPSARLVLYTRSILLFLFTAINLVPLTAQEDWVRLSGRVLDSLSQNPVADATIELLKSKEDARPIATRYSDEKGFFDFGQVRSGQYHIIISLLGRRRSYTIAHTRAENHTLFFPLSHQLREVVVTAQEGKRITSSSSIGQEAMAHLQPSSFADIMALLPGGKSSRPSLGEVNSILLRETGTLNVYGSRTNNPDYAISSLGTLFLVDGAPINTDGDLQAATSYSNPLAMGKLRLNSGVDMRTLSTDNIERVEFIRGVPSVEYGNVTSGVVLVHRKRTASPLYSRFKVDGYSRNFSLGKGFSVSEHHTLYGDLSYLDAKPDPRDIFETYKRLTGSIRYYGTSSDKIHTWEVSGDYTGSFDKNRVDPDITYRGIDQFFSDFNRFSLAGKYKFSPNPQKSGLKSIELSLATSQQLDHLWHRKLVAPSRMAIAPTGTEAGEHEANLLGREYIAEYASDGKPFSLFMKAQAIYLLDLEAYGRHELKGGLNYDATKNFGEGQLYDLAQPIFTVSWDSRPRSYKTIPALHQLALYGEDFYTLPIREHQLQIQAGLRLSHLPGLARDFALSQKFYLDPRINAQWRFPTLSLFNRSLSIAIDAGWGLTTRMPTLNYLYPDPRYIDITQLGYYDVVHPYERSLFYVRTYIEDATNYHLLATRNRKIDIRLTTSLGKNKLSVSYFNEYMDTGFRYRAYASVYKYNHYDATSIDHTTLTGKPDLTTIPFESKNRIASTSKPENGSMIRKEGIEFQLTTERIPYINTSLMVGGAWFFSTYSNSIPLFYALSGVYGDVILADRYRGLYDWQDGHENSRLRTNFLLDTQIPQWGLIITTAVETTWFTKRRRLPQDGYPIAYLDAKDGVLHPFTEESAKDPYLQHLVIRYDESLFKRGYIPIALGVNIKVSKKMGKHFTLSLFANNTIDYLPDYKVGEATLRRTSSPYFGMELRVSL